MEPHYPEQTPVPLDDEGDTDGTMMQDEDGFWSEAEEKPLAWDDFIPPTQED